jgi:hypothetical protein
MPSSPIAAPPPFASTVTPGIVSITAQSFAGDKTFTGSTLLTGGANIKTSYAALGLISTAADGYQFISFIDDYLSAGTGLANIGTPAGNTARRGSLFIDYKESEGATAGFNIRDSIGPGTTVFRIRNKHVGVGNFFDLDPGAFLSVKGDGTAPVAKLWNTDAGQATQIRFADSAGTEKVGLGYGNGSAGAPYAGNLFIAPGLNVDTIYATGPGMGSNKPSVRFKYNGDVEFDEADHVLYVDATNNRVGIGTATPGSSLTVTGAIESTSGGFKFPDTSTQLVASPWQSNPGASTWYFDTSVSNWTINMGTGSSSLRSEAVGINKSWSAGGPVLLVRRGTVDQPTGLGSGKPYLAIGGDEGAGAGGYYTIGFGWARTEVHGVEIGAVSTDWSGATKSDFIIATRDVTTNSAPTERLRVMSNGRVLIGTSTDDGVNALQVTGSGVFSSDLQVGSGIIKGPAGITRLSFLANDATVLTSTLPAGFTTTTSAFKLNTSNTLASGDTLLQVTNNGTNALRVFGNSSVVAEGTILSTAGIFAANATTPVALRGKITSGSGNTAIKFYNVNGVSGSDKITAWYSDAAGTTEVLSISAIGTLNVGGGSTAVFLSSIPASSGNAFSFNTTNTLAASDKIFQVFNNSAGQFYVQGNGLVVTAGAVQSNTGVFQSGNASSAAALKGNQTSGGGAVAVKLYNANGAAGGDKITAWYNDSGATSMVAYITGAGSAVFNGTLTVGSGITASSNIITLADPGVGQISGFKMARNSDNAGIYVTEYATDQTIYETWMEDNPDAASDIFTWRFRSFEGINAVWQPLSFANGIGKIMGSTLQVYPAITQMQSSKYWTVGDPTQTDARQWIQTANDLTKLKLSGTGTCTITALDVSACTEVNGTRIWIKLTSATTFDWGRNNNPSTGTTVETGKTVSVTGTTLSNGVVVTFSDTTGGVAGDTFQFRYYTAPVNTLNSTTFNGTLLGGTGNPDIGSTSSRFSYFFGLGVRDASNNIRVSWGGSTTNIYTAAIADGSTAIAHSFRNTVSLSNATAKLGAWYSDNGTTERFSIMAGGGIVPGSSDGTANIGLVGNRWQDIYLFNGIRDGSSITRFQIGSGSQPNQYRGAAADSSTAIAHKMANNPALVTAGAKIVSFYNDNVVTERAQIDYLGRYNGSVFAYGLKTIQMATPSGVGTSTSTTGGTLAAGTYYYRISAVENTGLETAASTEVSQVTTGTTSTVTITWGNVFGASSYKIYGRTTGAEQLIATVTGVNLTYTDDGSVTPSGALPTGNLTGSVLPSTDSTALLGARTVRWGTAYIVNFNDNSSPSVSRIALGGTTNVFRSAAADGSTAYGHKLQCSTTLSNAGAKIAGYFNDDGTTEQFYVLANGGVGIGVAQTVFPVISGSATNALITTNAADTSGQKGLVINNSTSIVTNTSNFMFELQNGGTAKARFNYNGALFLGGNLRQITAGASLAIQGQITAGSGNPSVKVGNGNTLSGADLIMALYNDANLSVKVAHVDLNGAFVSNANQTTSPAAGTGITTNYNGKLSGGTYSVTIDKAAFTAAALTQDIVLGQIPAKAMICGIYCDTTQAFAGTAGTLQISIGKTTGGAEFVLAHDVKTAAVTKGLADGDLGTSINRANAVQGGHTPSWSAATNVSLRLASSSGNLGNGTVTNLSAGSVTIYYTLDVL